MGMLEEMKKEAMDSVIDAIFEDSKTQQLLEFANPFIEPMVNGLSNKLGKDELRLSVFLDKEKGDLCFFPIQTSNLNIFENLWKQNNGKNVINPLTEPTFTGLLNELGNDDYRIIILTDKDSGLLCFMKIKSSDFKEDIEGGIKKEDVFLINPNVIKNTNTEENVFKIDPQEIKKGNAKDVIVSIIKKTGINNNIDEILEEPKAKQMLGIANPFIKPALSHLLKELGHDDTRLTMFLDKEKGDLCFYPIKTPNLNLFENLWKPNNEKDTINPLTEPTLTGLLNELGNDDYRIAIFKDKQTGRLCLWKIKTSNINSFDVGEIKKENVFVIKPQDIKESNNKKDIFKIDPQEIKKGNVKDVVGAIIKKVGIKLM